MPPPPPAGDSQDAAASLYPGMDDGDTDSAGCDDIDEGHLSIPTSATTGGGGDGGASALERRALFQRLWTEEDEIVILRGFAEFTAARGTAFASHQYDTDPFYLEMRRRLQLDFSKSQLSEKLRRLKRKYRNCVARLRSAGQSFAFRSPHEQAIFEIARNIWSPDSASSVSSSKHHRSDDEEMGDVEEHQLVATGSDDPNPNTNGSTIRPRQGRRRKAAVSTSTAVPITVKVEDSFQMPVLPATGSPAIGNLAPLSSPPSPAPAPESFEAAMAEKSQLGSLLSPLFKEIVRAAVNGPQLLQLDMPCGLEGVLGVPADDERWRKQRILELEVYLKRIELLQEQVRAALEELRAASVPAAGDQASE